MEFLGAFALTFAAVRYYPLPDPKSTASLPAPSLQMEAAKATFCLSFFTWAGIAISGAHFNPIVSIAMFMQQKLEAANFVLYIIFQAAGALLAGFVQFVLTTSVRAKFGDKVTWADFLPTIDDKTGIITATICEAIASFIFLTVFQAMIIEKRAPKGVNCFAIGAAYGLAILTIGAPTGGVLNPLIYFAPRIFALSSLRFDCIIAYTVGPFAGSLAAAVGYRFLLKDTTPEPLNKSTIPIRAIVI
jgi:aquaporin Z